MATKNLNDRVEQTIKTIATWLAAGFFVMLAFVASVTLMMDAVAKAIQQLP